MQEVFPYSFRYGTTFKKLYFLSTAREFSISKESRDHSYAPTPAATHQRNLQCD